MPRPPQLSQDPSEWVIHIHIKKKKVSLAILVFHQGWELVMKDYSKLKWSPNTVLFTFAFFSSKKEEDRICENKMKAE